MEFSSTGNFLSKKLANQNCGFNAVHVHLKKQTKNLSRSGKCFRKPPHALDVNVKLFWSRVELHAERKRFLRLQSNTFFKYTMHSSVFLSRTFKHPTIVAKKTSRKGLRRRVADGPRAQSLIGNNATWPPQRMRVKTHFAWSLQKQAASTYKHV